MINCICWAAVSSGPQAAGESLPEQIRDNSQFVAELERHYPGCGGGRVAVELTMADTRNLLSLEEAADRHDSYAALVDLALSNRKLSPDKKIGAIICRSRDRLGRTASLASQLEQFLLLNDIVVVPRLSNRPPSLKPEEVRENEGLALISVIESAMGQIEVRRMVRRRYTGLLKRARDRGLFPAKPPFGYTRIIHPDGGHSIVQDEEDAETVRTLFRHYLAGDNGRVRIVRAMNMSGRIPPSGGEEWIKRSVERILEHVHAYGGWIDLFYSSDRKETMRYRGSFEPILDEPSYRAVLAEMDRRRKIPHRGGRRPLAGICHCTICGRALVSDQLDSRSRPGHPNPWRKVTLTMACRKCQPTYYIRESTILAALQIAVDRLAEFPYDYDLAVIDTGDPDQIAERIRDQIAGVEGTLEALAEERKRTLYLFTRKGIDEMEFDELSSDILRRKNVAEIELSSLRERLVAEGHRKLAFERLDEIRTFGSANLELVASDPVMANQWLREHFRVHCQPHADEKQRIVRIDYI